eukprot:SAG31_NODE_216_length_20053_cov_9.223815_7_plen_99_part_00
MAAIFTAPSRIAALKTVDTRRTPVFVVHGEDDRFVRRENAQLLHASIAGAELLEVAGMAHSLEEDHCPAILERIFSMLERTESVNLLPRTAAAIRSRL